MMITDTDLLIRRVHNLRAKFQRAERLLKNLYEEVQAGRHLHGPTLERLRHQAERATHYAQCLQPGLGSPRRCEKPYHSSKYRVHLTIRNGTLLHPQSVRMGWAYGGFPRARADLGMLIHVLERGGALSERRLVEVHSAVTRTLRLVEVFRR